MEQELINLLKENLRIEVSHPSHDVGYFETFLEPDMENITVQIYYKDELICESTSY